MEPLIAALEGATFVQDAENQKLCQKNLQIAEKSAGFLLQLVSIFESTQISSTARWLAVVYLKNAISRNWERSGRTQAHEDEKPVVRSRLVNILTLDGFFPQETAGVAAQLPLQMALVIAKIASFDFPQNWPELIPGVINALQNSTSAEAMERNLSVTHHLVKELSSRVLLADRLQFAQIAPQLLSTLSPLFVVLTPPLLSNPAGTSIENRCFILLLKTMRRLLSVGFAQIFQIESAVQLLASIVQMCGQVAGVGEEGVRSRASHFGWKLLAEIAERHPLALVSFLEHLLTTSLQIFISASQTNVPPRCSIEAAKILSAVVTATCFRAEEATSSPQAAEGARIRNVFFSEESVRNLSSAVISQWIPMSPAEAEAALQDVESYIVGEHFEEEDGGGERYRMREATLTLLSNLAENYPQLVAGIFAQRFETTAPSGGECSLPQLLEREAVLRAMTSCLTQIRHHLNIEQVVVSLLQSDLPPSPPPPFDFRFLAWHQTLLLAAHSSPLLPPPSRLLCVSSLSQKMAGGGGWGGGGGEEEGGSAPLLRLAVGVALADALEHEMRGGSGGEALMLVPTDIIKGAATVLNDCQTSPARVRILWLANSVMEMPPSPPPPPQSGTAAAAPPPPPPVSFEGWGAIGAELAWIWSTVRDDPLAHPLSLRLMSNFVNTVHQDAVLYMSTAAGTADLSAAAAAGGNGGVSSLRSVALPVASSVLASCVEEFGAKNGATTASDEDAIEAMADLWLRILQIIQGQRTNNNLNSNNNNNNNNNNGDNNEVALPIDMIELLEGGVKMFILCGQTRTKACWIMEGTLLLNRGGAADPSLPHVLSAMSSLVSLLLTRVEDMESYELKSAAELIEICFSPPFASFFPPNLVQILGQCVVALLHRCLPVWGGGGEGVSVGDVRGENGGGDNNNNAGAGGAAANKSSSSSSSSDGKTMTSGAKRATDAAVDAVLTALARVESVFAGQSALLAMSVPSGGLSRVLKAWVQMFEIISAPERKVIHCRSLLALVSHILTVGQEAGGAEVIETLKQLAGPIVWFIWTAVAENLEGLVSQGQIGWKSSGSWKRQSPLGILRAQILGMSSCAGGEGLSVGLRRCVEKMMAVGIQLSPELLGQMRF